MGGGAFGGGGMFGGANPFSSSTGEDTKPTPDHDESDSDSGSDSEEDEEFRLAEEVAIKATLQEQEAQRGASDAVEQWRKGKRPYYKLPQYVNTIPEPSAAKSKKQQQQQGDKDLAASANDGSGAGTDFQKLEKEGYEKMLLDGIDATFERFVDRTSRLPSQLVRYEFGGEPLPFSNKGDVYKRYWPKRSQQQQQQQQALAPAQPHTSNYNGAAAGSCPICGAARTFELQLMPNVVNLLRPENIEGDEELDARRSAAAATNGTPASQEQRKREIERALGRSIADPQKAQDLAATGIHRSSDYKPSSEQDAGAAEAALEKTGLTWSTVLVFVCEKDCVGSSAAEGGKQALVEEHVEIMWEEM